jgi:hypothetical protein
VSDITLMASKASQDQAEIIIVPCADMPAACAAIDAWARIAELKSGQPIFRSVDQRQIIDAVRLTDRSVARIVKSRVRKLVRLQGRSETEADELVALVSGHSLRAGYATSAAARDTPAYRIQRHTRHKSAQMVAGYIREADKWTKSGLRVWGSEEATELSSPLADYAFHCCRKAAHRPDALPAALAPWHARVWW